MLVSRPLYHWSGVRFWPIALRSSAITCTPAERSLFAVRTMSEDLPIWREVRT